MQYHTVMKMNGLMRNGKTCMNFTNKMENKSQTQRIIFSMTLFS